MNMWRDDEPEAVFVYEGPAVSWRAAAWVMGLNLVIYLVVGIVIVSLI